MTRKILLVKKIDFEFVKVKRIDFVNLTCFCYKIFLSFVRKTFSINDFRKTKNLEIINTFFWSTIFLIIFCVRLFLDFSICVLFFFFLFFFFFFSFFFFLLFFLRRSYFRLFFRSLSQSLWDIDEKRVK